MGTSVASSEWKSLASDPMLRLRAVREYAQCVFGDETLAATWLSRAHRPICGGLIAVGAACQTAQGFFEAMAELARVEQFEKRDVNKRTQARTHFGDETLWGGKKAVEPAIPAIKAIDLSTLPVRPALQP
jgi:hypothetical protein